MSFSLAAFKIFFFFVFQCNFDVFWYRLSCVYHIWEVCLTDSVHLLLLANLKFCTIISSNTLSVPVSFTCLVLVWYQYWVFGYSLTGPRLFFFFNLFSFSYSNWVNYIALSLSLLIPSSISSLVNYQVNLVSFNFCYCIFDFHNFHLIPFFRTSLLRFSIFCFKIISNWLLKYFYDGFLKLFVR